MATMVYQGLQSCLESQFVESRTLRLRLSSPKPHFPQSLEFALKPCFLDSADTSKEPSEKCHHHEEITQKSIHLPDKLASSNSDSGGWSFLQALPKTSQGSQESSMEKAENTYVHPLVKRSSSRLSDKSLELCTENLGSETGTTDIIETSILLKSSSSSSDFEVEDNSSPTREQQQIITRQLSGPKKERLLSPRSLPPPLTTMSGSESLQVRSHREDGRLIIKAVKAPSTNTYFQTERSNGRLRLFLVKDSTTTPDFDLEAAGQASTEEENNVEINRREEDENDVNYDSVEEEQEEGFDQEQQGEEQQDGNNYDLDVGTHEMGMEELQRTTTGWCKGELEENKGLLNWKLSCVATYS